MPKIRPATIKDASRVAEILVFTKRINYRPIFQDDDYAFREMQILPLAQSYIQNPNLLKNIWVYDDGIVKAILNLEGEEIKELYVDSFFQNQGIGGELLQFAIHELNARFLWVLQPNHSAIRFYQAHGFKLTDETSLEPGTTVLNVKMVR